MRCLQMAKESAKMSCIIIRKKRVIAMAKLTMDKLVALCKNRGFIFAGSEIYGGLANTWDYGPLGVEYKNNIKKAW